MKILGTRTHFHDCQLYQERLDSDHVMDIEQLRRENPRPSRRTLDWLNPQAEVKVKYRHKKNYHNMLATLSIATVIKEPTPFTCRGLTTWPTKRTSAPSPFSQRKRHTARSRSNLQSSPWPHWSRRRAFFLLKRPFRRHFIATFVPSTPPRFSASQR